MPYFQFVLILSQLGGFFHGLICLLDQDNSLLEPDIETRVVAFAHPSKAEALGRILRRILRKALSLHDQLHQQGAKYLVTWALPKIPFDSRFMECEVGKKVRGTSRGFCAALPSASCTVQKLVRNNVHGDDAVVVAHAKVSHITLRA
jgi:hypothetical protein